MIPQFPRAIVVVRPGDTPEHVLAKARTAMRRCGAHWQEVEEFTALALSGDRDHFDATLAMTVTMTEGAAL